jgi:D-alanyl-D-alanine carboxypeptidase/D-alanyl-D-alanine carboxypeptidase (penicillin-binding protein 5/6)
LKRLLSFAVIFALLFCPVKTNALSINARASVLIDGLSGKVIYSLNENEKLSMASTTKIMTALILCEQENLEKEITVTKEMVAVEGTSMGLTVGTKVSLNDLLYGMLLSSGNDAANATAIAVGGNIDNFVSLMNKRAQELGLKNTHFDTPSGLDGDTHYTTALELALLTRYALCNERFSAAAKTKSISLKFCGANRTLYNHNKLLSIFDGAVGVKTGFTKKSGRCLVSAAERENGKVIAVTLNDPDDWNDHKELLNFGLEKLGGEKQTFSEKTYEVYVKGGKEAVVTAESTSVSFRTYKEKVIKKEFIMPYVSAPVKKGEEIGYIEYYCGNFLCAKEILTAQNDVDASKLATKPQLIIINFKRMLKLI